ncbi:MAG: lipoprotein-releasing ABC transporter permease subunit [bacterium]
MFRPLSLYIGLRYTRAKRRNHFISFISLASMLGIALGITVLITVLSVMNGFDYEIHSRIFSMARQVTVRDFTAGSNWREVKKEVEKNQDVIASAPLVDGQGILTKDGRVRGVVINGILPEQEQRVSQMQKTVEQGSMLALKPGEFSIVLGQTIARHLDASVGDKVVLVTPTATMTPMGIEPRFRRFTVVGIFHVGEGFGYDAQMVFVNLYDAQKLFALGDNITGLNLKIKDLDRAPLVSAELEAKLNGEYYVSNWTHEFGPTFKAIQMEKTTMFIVLLFIIAVAAFNLISSLVMSVNDKQSDIAILRTLGASPRMIMSIFMVQGGIIGVLGTLLGVVGGVILALSAPELVSLLEQICRTHFISASVYWIDYLPSRLVWSDVWHVGLATLIMSLLATIYPAWRAAKTQPAEALRYE